MGGRGFSERSRGLAVAASHGLDGCPPPEVSVWRSSLTDPFNQSSDPRHHPTDRLNHLTDRLDHPTDRLNHPTDPIDHPTDPLNHPSDWLDHPTDRLDHPTDPSDHPTDRLNHPTDPSVHYSGQCNRSTGRGHQSVNGSAAWAGGSAKGQPGYRETAQPKALLPHSSQ